MKLRPIDEEILKTLHHVKWLCIPQISEKLKLVGIKCDVGLLRFILTDLREKRVVESKGEAMRFCGRIRDGWRLTGLGVEERHKAGQKSQTEPASNPLPEPAVFSTTNLLAELIPSVR